MAFYLLKEDGGKILLEDLSGAVLLEGSAIPGPTVDWQAGGAGYPVSRKKRRNRTEELFQSIEQTLAVALGLVEAPDEVAPAAEEAAPAPRWSEQRFRVAIERLRRLSQDNERDIQRVIRLQAMLRAYEEAQERQRIQDDEEETWFLMG